MKSDQRKERLKRVIVYRKFGWFHWRFHCSSGRYCLQDNRSSWTVGEHRMRDSQTWCYQVGTCKQWKTLEVLQWRICIRDSSYSINSPGIIQSGIKRPESENRKRGVEVATCYSSKRPEETLSEKASPWGSQPKEASGPEVLVLLPGCTCLLSGRSSHVLPTSHPTNGVFIRRLRDHNCRSSRRFFIVFELCLKLLA